MRAFSHVTFVDKSRPSFSLYNLHAAVKYYESADFIFEGRFLENQKMHFS